MLNQKGVEKREQEEENLKGREKQKRKNEKEEERLKNAEKKELENVNNFSN